MSPQHDYVIDNSTGANVRSDINSVLQAIASNNSGSSAPSTTYAFQLFADTTNNVMKIRNAANNAFIELFQLDGTLTLEDGSASTPALAFRDDLNTGIFSSAADICNISAGGVERAKFGSAGVVINDDGADVDFRIEGDSKVNLFYLNAGTDRIGINENSPSALFHVAGTDGQTVGTISSSLPLLVSKDANAGIGILARSDSKSIIAFGDPDDSDIGKIEYIHSENALTFTTNTTERFRIDSSGRLLFGISSSTRETSLVLQGNSNNYTTNPAVIELHQGQQASSASTLGQIIFGCTGNRLGAVISGIAQGDYNSGSSHPTKITFKTCNQSSTTLEERMAITRDGSVGIGISTPARGPLHVHENSGSDCQIHLTNDDTGATSGDGLTIFTDTDDAGIWSRENVPFLFATNNAEKMRLSATGMLSINSSSGALGGEKLRVVNGGSSANVAGFFFNNTQDRTNLIIKHDRATGSTAAIMIDFIDQLDGSSGSIQSNGSSTTYSTSSDYRLKENAVAISDGITRLKTLKPYRFNFKVDPTTTVDGFFAHEVTAVPEAVLGEKDAMKPLSFYEEGDTIPSGKQVGDAKTFSETEIKPQTIDQSKLVPLLVAAVQELIGKVEALEAA
tara:strand:- start:256 stop:2121 length:1866 start_codon:yes stop_codon:yes gene_type:complete